MNRAKLLVIPFCLVVWFASVAYVLIPDRTPADPKFFYGQKLQVTKGFHRGCVGTAIDIDSRTYGKTFIWLDADDQHLLVSEEALQDNHSLQDRKY